MGYTPELAVAVWVGYPDALRPMETEFNGEPVSGGTLPAEIWKAFMTRALNDTAPERFDPAPYLPAYDLRVVHRAGRWQLDNGWRAQVPGFDEAELRALLMAQPRVIGDRRLAEAADRAIQKLMAALPVSMRARAASIKQRLHVDTTAWYGGTDALEFLPVVQEAVSNDRKLAMRYMRDLDLPYEKVNVNGGAIAMGHPLGATGAMILGTLIDELERRDLRYGLATLCVGGGMGIATIVERI